MTVLRSALKPAESSIVPIALFAILAVLVVPLYPHFPSPNEFSRWAVAVAIVEFHTIEVTPVVRMTGVRVEDLSERDGRLYSNKAPGALLAGLPGYAAARLFVGPPTPRNMRVTMNAMRLMASTIPALLLAFAVHVVARRFGNDERRSRFAVVTLLFGTPLFAYGLLLFAHALAAAALFGAWALLFASERRPRNEIFAGLLIGLSVLAEYPSAVPAAVIVACALPVLRLGGTVRVVAGGLPFALLLALYNRAAFGSLFALSSGHESAAQFRELARTGLFGVGMPSPGYIAGLLFDPSKGLLVFSPVLLLAFAGVGAARRALPRSAFVALLAAPLSILLMIGGYPNWFGGWTVGARYLVSALPFLVLLLAFARTTIVDHLLLGASILAVAAVTLVFPFVPPGYPAPWITFAWPILEDGYVMPNLLHLVWRPAAIAVPFVLVLCAAFASATKARSVISLAAGAALWIVAGMIAATSASREPPYIRARVEEVHFGHSGTMARELPPGPQRRFLEADADATRRLPPPDWPF